jgi:hypothetical protein
MTYGNIFALTWDQAFNGRVTACCTQQAEIFRNDARPDFVALANDVLLGDGRVTSTFTRIIAAAPGIADKAATGDGIDQTKVTDDDILSTVQANWQVVAGLYYDDTGAPLEGG